MCLKVDHRLYVRGHTVHVLPCALLFVVWQATDDTLLGKSVVVKGWVRTKRDQKTFSFVEVNDGSCMKGVQVRTNSGVNLLTPSPPTLDYSEYAQLPVPRRT